MTVAVLAAKSTVPDFTPATPFIAFVTVTGHMAHVLFSMLNVVFWTAAACAGAACAASGEIVGAERRPAAPRAAATRARRWGRFIWVSPLGRREEGRVGRECGWK